MSLHDGHRSRMRERFRKEGLDGFAPHEALELLLYYAKARGDLNPLAHELLEVFGSLKGVLEAKTEQLMTVRGVGPETATLLSMIVPMFRKYQECVCAENEALFQLPAAKQYCLSLMAGQRSERLYLISLSTTGRLVGRRLLSEGSLDEVQVHPRNVVEAALNHNAHAVILCHNHPGGLAQPSQADVRTTNQIEMVLASLGIHLVDHIIIAGGTCCSLCQLGYVQRARIEAKNAGVLEYVLRDEGALEQ